MKDLKGSKVETLEEKEKKLIHRLHELGHVAIAYSGGVDSTYLLSVAQSELQENAIGIFVRGAMISQEEEKEALKLAQELKFQLKVLDINVFDLDSFVANSIDRCYFCKKHLFAVISNLANKEGYTVIEGTNFSDITDYRPGRKALSELAIESPLLEAELTKEEIRELSRRRNLPTWNKPSMACLASRVPYGDKITPEILKRIEKAERVLHQKGFMECRVRSHSDLARIEIPTDQFEGLLEVKEEIIKDYKDLGFRFITMDLIGLRTGSFNPNGD